MKRVENPQRKPLTSVLVKPAGPDCNMACRYCFYLEKTSRFPGAAAHRMSEEVLEALVRQVMGRGGREVSFAWQGGEPTLMGLPFFEHAVGLQREYGRPGQSVGNGIQTNGLLIDEDWCRFLHGVPFLVGLSLDGPEHVHGRYRLSQGGAGTWRRVVDSLHRLLDAGVEVNSLSVVSDTSAGCARETYEFLKREGLEYLQFIPCVEDAPHSVTGEQYGSFLCELFDCWMGDFEGGLPTIHVRWFDSLFYTYVGLPPPECTLLPECGTYVVVEHDGDVFSCDFYVEDEWRLGNVMEGDLAAMLNSGRQRDFGLRKAALAQRCRECKWLRHCHGGCPKDRLDGSLSHLCEGYLAFFEHANRRLVHLAEAWLAQEGNRKPEVGNRPRPDTQYPAPDTLKLGRNDLCPCGSGKKVKHCRKRPGHPSTSSG